MKELAIKLPAPPEPFGTYVEAVQTGNLFFLSGMLATSGHTATVVGVVSKDLDVKAGREAAYTAALNVLALTKKQLGSLNRVGHVVRLNVYIATLQPGMVMDVDEMVDAELIGLDRGESVTIPSLPAMADCEAYEVARERIIPTLSRSVPPPGYGITAVNPIGMRSRFRSPSANGRQRKRRSRQCRIAAVIQKERLQ